MLGEMTDRVAEAFSAMNDFDSIKVEQSYTM